MTVVDIVCFISNLFEFKNIFFTTTTLYTGYLIVVAHNVLLATRPRSNHGPPDAIALLVIQIHTTTKINATLLKYPTQLHHKLCSLNVRNSHQRNYLYMNYGYITRCSEIIAFSRIADIIA